VRTELQTALKQKKIIANGVRLAAILMHAELDGIICSGPRQGKQFTYALLEERVPPVKALNREEALAAMIYRYFNTRGPATLQDFTSWSGLTMKDAIAGAGTLPGEFIKEKIEGKEYIFKPIETGKMNRQACCFLMPDYDEYGMSYKDRSAIFDQAKGKGDKRGGNFIFNHMVVIDGVIAGTWERKIKGNKVTVEAFPFDKLTASTQKILDRSVNKYRAFTNC
jgi:hypothetical protein